MTTSSSLRRPYIGSCRNRDYITNKLFPSSLLSNDYYFSTIPLSKSFLPNQFKHKIYLLNRVTTNDLQERVPIEYVSSPIPLDERQLHQEQKAKGFLSSSSSSSPFLLHTTENTTPRSYYDHSPSSSFAKEQQKFRQNQQYSDYQSYNSQKKTNQSVSSEQSLIYNRYIENNNSFLPSNDNNTSKNQSNHLSSTSIPSSITPTNTIALLSPTKNKSLSKIVNCTLARSPTTTTDVYPIEDMSSIRYSSATTNPKSPPSSTTHTYDQRISDQGNKYIIQIKTDDYQENDFVITPRYNQNQIIIDAKHNEEDSSGGYVRRELHKIFHIPKHIDLNQYTYSYNKNTQELTIEMPYLQSIINENKSDNSFIPPIENKSQSLTFSYGNLNLTNDDNVLPKLNKTDTGINNPTNDLTKPFDFDLFHRSAFRPQILHTTPNENIHEKKLLMSLDLADYQPEDIKVTVKDQELIVKAERKIETDTRKSRTSFFQSTSLPPQTDIERLQSNYIDGKLIIEAPYLEKKIKPTNEQTIIESQQKTITDDPFQQKTETVIEFIRRRRL